MDKSKTKFGFGQLTAETPLFAQWIFRGWLILAPAISGLLTGLAATQGVHISPTTIAVVLLVMQFLNLIIYGVSKLFGVVTEPVDPDKSLLADKQVDDQGNTNAINPVVAPTPDPAPTVVNLKDLEASEQ